MSTFRCLEYLLWGGVRIFTERLNLAYIFEPEACDSSVLKTAAQRLENWKMVLTQYDFMVMHVSEVRNCWADMLSRRVSVLTVAARAPGETIPSDDAIHEVQQQARAGLGAMVSGASCSPTPVGRLTNHNEDLFRVRLDDRDVLWIPEQANKIQVAHSVRS